MKKLFLSFSIFILSCASKTGNFSILEFEVQNNEPQSYLETQFLDSVHSFLNTGFNLIIIKNLQDKNALNLINKRILFNRYLFHFIPLSNNRSISVLFRSNKVNVKVLSILIRSTETKLGTFLKFVFGHKSYGIFVYNFTEKIVKNLDFNLLNEQINYLAYSVDNLLLILDKNEISLSNYLEKYKLIPLVSSSKMDITVEKYIDERIYANFTAQFSFYRPHIVIKQYLDNNNLISNFPKSIVILNKSTK